MIYDYEQRAEDEQINLPNFEEEFANAKTYLQKASSETGDNLYDHLTEVLNKLLAERPENVIDFFEEYSRRVKEKRYRPLTDHLEDVFVPPRQFSLAKRLMPLLKPPSRAEPSTVDPDDVLLADMANINLLEWLYYYEEVGIGIPRDEVFLLLLSVKKLIRTQPIASIRFWGKIYGLYKNYTIVECDLKDDEIVRRNQEQQRQEEQQRIITEESAVKESEEQIAAALNEFNKHKEIGGEGGKKPRILPPLPISLYQVPPEPPIEITGIGTNKKVYYVSTDVDEEWHQLPDVTPKQIRVARLIYKSFTGNLEQEVLTYPEFPGVEKHYLRAQIARISAGTHISPLGFYTFGVPMVGEGGGFDEEEMDEVPGDDKTSFIENPRYEPLPLRDLVDRSMNFWVHHTPYILPQGRTTFWSPNIIEQEVGGEDMGDEEEEEEEEKKINQEVLDIENGPPLLTPCSEDATLEGVPPWSVRSSSKLLEEFAVVVVRSNIWPGAYTFATQGKMFQNVYFGYGHKHLEHNFSPAPLPPVQQDYVIGPEVMEILDPTGNEEEEWRIAHQPKPPEISEMLEGEEDEEGEEEEEEEEEIDEDD